MLRICTLDHLLRAGLIRPQIASCMLRLSHPRLWLRPQCSPTRALALHPWLWFRPRILSGTDYYILSSGVALETRVLRALFSVFAHELRHAPIITCAPSASALPTKLRHVAPSALASPTILICIAPSALASPKMRYAPIIAPEVLGQHLILEIFTHSFTNLTKHAWLSHAQKFYLLVSKAIIILDSIFQLKFCIYNGWSANNIINQMPVPDSKKLKNHRYMVM